MFDFIELNYTATLFKLTFIQESALPDEQMVQDAYSLNLIVRGGHKHLDVLLYI